MKILANRVTKWIGGAALTFAALAMVTASAWATPLSITTVSFPNATAHVAYSQTATATDGTAPYAWSISVGALPAGLSLDPDTGEISGSSDVAGAYSFTLVVTDAVSNSASLPTSITVDAGPAYELAVVTEPGTTTAGQAITPHFTVQVKDQYGNARSDAGLSVSIAAPPAAGTLDGTTTRSTDGSGQAAFDDLALTVAGTGYQLTATTAGLQPGVSSAFDIVADSPRKVVFEVPPGDIAAGSSFSPDISVGVRDQYDNPVSTATNTVTLELTAGGGALVGTTTRDAASGVASFAGLTIETAGAGKQITATSEGLDPALSATF